jgi:prevent-host-death family protein
MLLPECLADRIIWSQRPEGIAMKAKSPDGARTGGTRPPGNRWRLQDAKARLSELVREAQKHGPQRVTLHGRDAVVVVRADEFDRLQRPVSGGDILAALAASPLADVDIGRVSVKCPVPNVDL